MGRKNTMALEEVELKKQLTVGGESIRLGLPDLLIPGYGHGPMAEISRALRFTSVGWRGTPKA